MYSYTCILFDTLQYFTVVDSDQSSDAYSSASSDHESSDTEGMWEYVWNIFITLSLVAIVEWWLNEKV